MALIDYSRLISAEAVAEQARESGLAARRAECGARLAAVFGAHGLANLQGAMLAGLLDEDEGAIFRAGQVWLAGMLDHARAGPGNTQAWPAPPEGLEALVQRY